MVEADDPRRFLARTLEDLKNGCDVTIVAFGDSITAGYAVRRGFPSFWKEMLQRKYPEAKIEMINSGVSGDTTMDGLARLDWSVLSYEPDLVTINFGINDCVLRLGLEEFEMNFVEMVRRIRAGPGSEILLLSSQPLETLPMTSWSWITIKPSSGWRRRWTSGSWTSTRHGCGRCAGERLWARWYYPAWTIPTRPGTG
jgi:hypothetical protein